MLTKQTMLVTVTVLATLLMANDVRAEQVTLDVSPSYKVLMADQKQTTWVRVGVTGFEMGSEKQRPPVNVAIVLDKSGSMNGEKIAKAREAAMDAIDRLDARDIVSIVTYDTTVNVLVPATKLTDKAAVKKAISQVQSNGGTALFAGVSKGAAELRKFIDQEYVNRIVLLSDGLANEGPSSPSELGALGASLKKEGISVSTLGLGLDYNEDLMAKLAARSGGNHHFIERATELADVFNNEFDAVTSVVAQDVKVKITVPDGIRPVRVLGEEADILGQKIQLTFSQLYSKQNRHIVLEVEVPNHESGQKLKLAKVSATYQNMQSGEQDQLSHAASIKFSDQKDEIEASLVQPVMEDVVAFVANEQNRLATDYLDAGDFAKCVDVLNVNNTFLLDNAIRFKSDRLQKILTGNTLQLNAVQNNDYGRARKDMRFFQNQILQNGGTGADFSKLEGADLDISVNGGNINTPQGQQPPQKQEVQQEQQQAKPKP